MFKEYFSQELKEGEKVIGLIRKHWASFIIPVIKVIFFLVLPLFFMSILFAHFWGVLIFFLWEATVLAYAIHSWIIWYFDCFIITDQRIVDIDQRNVFSREVSETSLTKIQDVTYKMEGVLATLFNYGTVIVQTAGNIPKIEMNFVFDPKSVQELIVNLQKSQGSLKLDGEMTAKELIEFIAKAKKETEQPAKKD